ncbi:hypothetical protein [Pseudomonas taiwanensis]|uniref:Uncharacterized protein n=1 Tax=Pseudomonas taiwanensis TaxID=470150 RepID=A0ABR6V8V4_9PSED|nr:hypothetical protein [Pseudomonas taiwanensis]MBC3476543.1 hypothetical protein [Pseudomonas taiwanensis]MBC3490696.1 hypothetical protein [Pseudomonas taiwanensis]
MTDHVAHSFTATLEVAESPINTLGSMTTGQVDLDSPQQTPGYAVQGNRTLGLLNGSDADWQHGQELGLVNFDKGEQPVALVLYFRHSDAGYRLYVRSGPHFGEGVFTTSDGLVNVEPIGSQDPALWTLTDVQLGEPFDVTQLEEGRREIQLVNAKGHGLEIHNLYPVGGFLACHQAAEHSTVSLVIKARGVDWANLG